MNASGKSTSGLLSACLAAAILVGMAAMPVEAKSERKARYTREEVFRCFIRLLRVDLEQKILEKDLDGGFVLFEYKEPIYKRQSPASLEIIEIEAEERDKGKDKNTPEAEEGFKVKLRLEIKRAGASDEIGLLDKLESKLRDDYGRR